MKRSKILLIAVVVLTIAASVVLMILQHAQVNVQGTIYNVQLPESTGLAETQGPALTTPSLAKTPDSGEVSQPENHVSRPNPIGPAFTVYINGKTVSIAYGVDERTLDKGPGWLESSALPGQDGMCVVYGHRNNTHLRILETVEAGDTITTTLPDGTKYTYIVTQVQAFDKTEDLKIPTIDGTSIALITCYPFRYSGNAPGKYLVIGQLDVEAVN
jgi:sortase A